MNNLLEVFIAITKWYPSALDQIYLPGNLQGSFTLWPVSVAG